jgi:glycosyltransferase involved in cell wall biosynthesis
MKIVQFVPYFPPYLGGQENYIFNLSKHLITLGHEVHIITSDYPKSESFQTIDGISIERHPCLARPLGNPIVLNMMKKQETLKQYDIVHIHNEHSFPAIIAAKSKKSVKKPLVLTCHGQLKFGNLLFDGIEKTYSQYIGRYIFTKSDRIVVLSNSDRDYILSFGINREKIMTIPNAIDPLNYTQQHMGQTDLEIFKSKYNLKGKRIILYVGQIIPRKGINFLIRAIPIVKEKLKDNDLIFIFIGSGSSIDALKKQADYLEIGSTVLFTGSVSSQDLCMFYKSSELYVLPSLSEGLPTTILEAMYFGLPVISTNIPGIRDHFFDTALLVPPRDENALAESIINLLTDTVLAKRLSQTGKHHVLSRYTWDRVAKEYEALYKNVIGY